MAAMCLGLLVVGLGRGESKRRAHFKAVMVVIVIIGIEAAKYHAI
jgi:hypothetical protein